MSEDEGQDLPSSRDQLMREASHWFARMRGPDAEAHRAEFEAWLARGALHRRAYNRAAEIFAMGKLLADDKDGESAQVDDNRRRRRRRVMIAAVAGALLIFAAWATFGGVIANMVVPGMSPRPGGGAGERIEQYATVTGETRTLRLADGSLVTIGADSSLTVNFTSSERLLRLERGRARFEVHHERRPFIVAAGTGTVTARGTIFDVTVGAGQQVTVRLVRGSVDVAFPRAEANGQSAVRRLGPGESVSFSPAGSPEPVTSQAVNPQLIHPLSETREVTRDYDDVSVADIIAEANRNARVRIQLAAPGVSEQRISGHFRIDDPARLADRLAALFDLAIDRSDTTEIVLSPR
jgi:transmembrane sensor